MKNMWLLQLLEKDVAIKIKKKMWLLQLLEKDVAIKLWILISTSRKICGYKIMTSRKICGYIIVAIKIMNINFQLLEKDVAINYLLEKDVAMILTSTCRKRCGYKKVAIEC